MMSTKRTDLETIYTIVSGFLNCSNAGWNDYTLTHPRDFSGICINIALSMYLTKYLNGEELFWGLFLFYTLFHSIHCFLIGLPDLFARINQKNILYKTAIRNYNNEVPNVKSIKTNIDKSISIKLDLQGTDPELFEKKKKIIETTYGLHYHGLIDSENPRFKNLLLTPITIPNLFKFEETIKEIKPYQVVIGKGVSKTIVSDLRAWPHGLIAGSTGSGKSVQLKSIIAQVIYSTPNSKLFLCDLKGGVEFSVFEGIKNVEIFSEIAEIVAILENIVTEMEARFVFMKQEKIQSIDPEKHKKPFIFLVVDESSLLYRKGTRGDKQNEVIERGRIATQKILKLGRASRISVLFGLQRPSKESIDTEIQENIDARMCFKVNTIEGSIRMIGNKNGLNLPPIPGRGIWKYGNLEEVYQAPFITQNDIDTLKLYVKDRNDPSDILTNITKIDQSKLPTKEHFKESKGENNEQDVQ